MAKKEFWDQKEPSEWSEKEVKRLLTNSPWAKDAAVEFNMDDMPGGGPPGGGPPGGGPPGGGPPGGGMDGGMPSLKATVRWESAKPIRLATHQQTGENAENYVISVTGLMGGGRGGGRGPGGAPPDSEDGRGPNRFQPKATLECKGRPAVTFTDSEVLRKDTGTVMLFTYAKESLPDAPECKEILFVAQVGPLEITAKFLPKEMIYREHLEL
jgi:hypothetical protein